MITDQNESADDEVWLDDSWLDDSWLDEILNSQIPPSHTATLDQIESADDEALEAYESL